jgi:hypothetical protein
MGHVWDFGAYNAQNGDEESEIDELWATSAEDQREGIRLRRIAPFGGAGIAGDPDRFSPPGGIAGRGLRRVLRDLRIE